VTTAPTASSDRGCSPCVAGSSFSNDSNSQCMPASSCTAAQFQSVAG
jgi:hypothetical protein